MKIKNEIGHRYGKLTVIDWSERDPYLSNNHTYWKCKCDCGQETIVSGNSLRRNKVTSCGCAKYINEKNNRYGGLLVIEPLPSKSSNGTKKTRSKYWKCLCDCGNETNVLSSRLRSGETTSCGCRNIPSEVGNKYGKLLVKEKVIKSISDKYRNKTFYLCLCECGNEIISRPSILHARKNISCGCNKLLTSYEAQYSSAYAIYQKYTIDGADLLFDDFFALSQLNCFYCNAIPNNKYNRNKHSGNVNAANSIFIYNGLDRINNNFLHTKNNVVPCCKICNCFKSDRTLQDMLLNINSLLENPNIKYASDLCYLKNKLKDIPKNLSERQAIGFLFSETYNQIKYTNYKEPFLLCKIDNKRRCALERGHKWELSYLEAAELMVSSCIYCGRDSNIKSGYFNGIDRIDNASLYSLSNSVSCCKYCNFAKNNLPLDSFLNWIKRIKNNYTNLLIKAAKFVDV